MQPQEDYLNTFYKNTNYGKMDNQQPKVNKQNDIIEQNKGVSYEFTDKAGWENEGSFTRTGNQDTDYTTYLRRVAKSINARRGSIHRTVNEREQLFKKRSGVRLRNGSVKQYALPNEAKEVLRAKGKTPVDFEETIDVDRFMTAITEAKNSKKNLVGLYK